MTASNAYSKDKYYERVTPSTCIAFALPQVAAAMVYNPIYVIQGIYVKYYGFSMAALATVLLLSRLLDAISDPLIGALSDWWKKRYRTRKSFVGIGGCLLMMASFQIYIPPENPDLSYFTVWLFAFFVGLTIFFVPHVTWGGELGKRSHDKTRIFSYFTAAGYIGLVIFYGVPLFPFFETSEITPETLKISVILAIILFVPSIVICLFYVPEGKSADVNAGLGMEHEGFFNIKALFAVCIDPIYLRFIIAYFITMFGIGVWYSMVFIFVDIYLGLGSLFAPLYVVSFGIGIASAFGCSYMSQKIGKKKCWLVGVVVGLSAVIATSFLQPDRAPIWLLVSVVLGTMLTLVFSNVISRSILSDIVDYSAYKYRQNNGATYYSFYIFVDKVVIAIASAVGLWLADWLGFDPHLANQSKEGIIAMRVVMTYLPLFFLCLSLLLIIAIPMNEERHRIIRKRLDSLDSRCMKTDFFKGKMSDKNKSDYLSSVTNNSI